MKTVDKYLFSNFIKPFLVCIVSFIGLLLFVDSAEKLRPFVSYSKSAGEGSWSLILSYLFGSITVYFVNFLPFVIALSGAIAHVNLNKTGQLMALYSFGLNHHRVFRFPLLLSFGLGLMVMLMNISYLPNTIREVENSSRMIRGLSNKNKAFIHEEKITFQDQNLELGKNKLNGFTFPVALNPPVFQIVNFSEMVDLNHFKKIIVTRLDANRKIRQRFLLYNCVAQDGYIHGEEGITQDYNPNGDLFEEKGLSKEKSVLIRTNIYGDSLIELISLYELPKQSSLKTLLENYQLKVARDEFFRRLLLPLECVLMLLLSMALSCLFNLKNLYMCFTVMILVALIDLVTNSIPLLFFANFTSAIPIFSVPIFLFLIAKAIFKKARI